MVLLSVVLPTYDEAGSIQTVLADLSRELAAIEHEILVIDDDSPDETWRLAEAYATTHPTIRVLRRMDERGLSSAVVEGFRRARGLFVVVMDADGQHPPEVVPRLLDAALREDADLVVGSRRVRNGGTEGFSAMRRVISWGANMLAITAVPAVRKHRVRDPVSGFFLVRRTRLPDLATLRPRGYKILIDLLARAPLTKVVEVGYVFTTRRAGASKLRVSTQWEYLVHVLRIAVRERENQRIALFALVGLTGVVVNLAPLAVAEVYVEVGGPLRQLLLAAGAREMAILWNFSWNETITFRDLRELIGRGPGERLLRFHVATLLSFVVYLGVFWVVSRAGLGLTASGGLGILAGFVTNYLGTRWWAYGHAKRAPKAGT